MKFIIYLTHDVPLNMVGQIFDRIQSKSPPYIIMKIYCHLWFWSPNFYHCQHCTRCCWAYLYILMGSINNITLSCSIGHSRLHLFWLILNLVDPHKNAQPRDHEISVGEIATQAKASCITTHEKIFDVVQVEINRQTLEVINAAHMEVCTAMSKLCIEINTSIFHSCIEIIRVELNSKISRDIKIFKLKYLRYEWKSHLSVQKVPRGSRNLLKSNNTLILASLSYVQRLMQCRRLSLWSVLD